MIRLGEEGWTRQLSFRYLTLFHAPDDSEYFIADRQLPALLRLVPRCNVARDQAALIELLRIHKHGECVDLLFPMLSHRCWIDVEHMPDDLNPDFGEYQISLTPAGQTIVNCNLADPEILDEVYKGIHPFSELRKALINDFPDIECVRTLKNAEEKDRLER